MWVDAFWDRAWSWMDKSRSCISAEYQAAERRQRLAELFRTFPDRQWLWMEITRSPYWSCSNGFSSLSKERWSLWKWREGGVWNETKMTAIFHLKSRYPLWRSGGGGGRRWVFKISFFKKLSTMLGCIMLTWPSMAQHGSQSWSSPLFVPSIEWH